MLTIVIIIALAVAFYTGARRGLVMQIILTVGYILSLAMAKKYYLILANKIELLVPYPAPNADSKLVFFEGESLFKLDQAFYAGLAFLLILFVGWLITRFVGILCHNLTFFPLVKQVNILGGGILSFVIVYMGIFFALSVLAMIPVDFIQNMFRGSGIARFIVGSTPYFSNQVVIWWLNTVG